MPSIADCTLQFTADKDGDGNIDEQSHREYDAEGRLVAGSTISFEQGTDYHYSYEYDLAGCNYISIWTGMRFAQPFTELYFCECDVHRNPRSCFGEFENGGESQASHVTFEYQYAGNSNMLLESRELRTTNGQANPVHLRDYRQPKIGGWIGSGPSRELSQRTILDAFGRTATTEMYAERPDLQRPRLQTDTWYDTIYHLRESTVDNDRDGSFDEITQWDCTEFWPWSCTATIDGRDAASVHKRAREQDYRPVDDVIDEVQTESWTCNEPYPPLTR